MKQRILLLFVLVTVLGSCTSMYKSGQTPDDVYFSPVKEAPAYVETENSREDRYNEDYLDERYLRMKSMNRNRWSAFDNDFMYWNDYRWNNQVYFNSFRPYSFNNFGFGYNPMMGYGYNPMMGYGNGFHSGFYNPFLPGFYGTPVVVVARPVNPKAYAPRNGNLGTYTPGTSSYSTDPKTGNRTYNLSGSRTVSNSSGGSYYTPSNRTSRTYSNGNESRTYSAPSRSFDNSNGSNSTRSSSNSSSSSGSSSSGSSGGSAPVRSFPRGGN